MEGRSWGDLMMPIHTEAERLLKQAFEAWKTEAPKLALWAEDNLPEGFAVFDFPYAPPHTSTHHQWPRTDQPGDQTAHPCGVYLSKHRILSAPRLRSPRGMRRRMDDRQNLSQPESVITTTEKSPSRNLQKKTCTADSRRTVREPLCREPSWRENMELRSKKAIEWGLPQTL
jgi:hypothetical protein